MTKTYLLVTCEIAKFALICFLNNLLNNFYLTVFLSGSMGVLLSVSYQRLFNEKLSVFDLRDTFYQVVGVLISSVNGY